MCFKQTLPELIKKRKSQLMTALREGVTATRLADYYNDKMNKRLTTGNITIIDTGEQTTICGSGEIFNKFLQSGKIENFSGFGQKPVNFYDSNFEVAPFRMITYDQTFRGMPYDCSRGNKIYL